MKTLFVTTKNIDYIRNSQEIRMLREQGSQVELLYSSRGNYPLRMIEIYVKLLFKPMREYDEVFVGFSPQLIVPVFWRKLKRHGRLTVDFFISVYDTFVNDRKRFRKGSFLARFSHWVDRVTYQKADRIIVDTQVDGEYFTKEFGQLEKGQSARTEVLYMEADENIYYPRNVERPAKCKDKYVVLYFGSILPLQGVDVILDALRQLKEDDRFFFYMVGPLGNKMKPVISDNIEYIDWLPQETLADHIAMADLCLAGHFHGEIEKAKRTIPGKAYIYHAMYKPMVLGDSPANRELFYEGEPGIYFVPMGDADALADKIRELGGMK